MISFRILIRSIECLTSVKYHSSVNELDSPGFIKSHGPIGSISQILSSKNQIALGLLISGASLIAFPFFKSEFMIYGLIVLFAAGGAMVTPNLLSAVSLLSKTNTGRNISIQSSTNSIGQILGPVLGTWLVTGGFYYPFIVAGIIVLIAISFLFFLKNPYRHKK